MPSLDAPAAGPALLLPLAVAAALLAAWGAALFTAAWEVGVRLHPPRELSARLGAAAAVALALPVIGFELLALVDGFTPLGGSLTAAVWAAAGLALRRRAPAEPSRLPAVAAARAALRGLSRPARLLLGATGVAALLQLARALVAPPLAWDSLTYHLVKAGRWVQAGGRWPEAAPDAWGYYEHFPDAGDVHWAWAMLPVHGDALLALAPFAVWLAVLLAGYGLARQLGAGREPAVLSALVIGLAPAVFRPAVTASIDNTMLACVLLGLQQLAAHAARPRAAVAGVAGAALGLAAAVKLTGLPLLAVGGAAAVAIALRRRGDRPVRALAAFAGAAGVLALPHLVRTWAATGSPVYPAALELGGWLRLPGNPQLAAVLAAAGGAEPAAVDLVASLATGAFGFGPSFVAVLLAAPVGLLRVHRDRLPLAVALAAVAAVQAVTVLSPEMASQRVYWLGVTARLWTPAFASLVVLATLAVGRRRWPGWVAAAAALPLSLGFVGLWGPVDVAALSAWLPWLAVAAAAVLAPRWSALARRPAVRVALAAGALVVATARLETVRRDHRYPLWREAARDRSLSLHELGPHPLAWPLWRALDDGVPERVAFTAGWGYRGHNWFRYPLMGERLENQVVYVPITSGGETIDYVEPGAEEAFDEAAWWRRLRERRIDAIVICQPWPPEARPLAARELALACRRSGEDGQCRLCRLPRQADGVR